MTPWLIWTVVALGSWGIWAVLSKLLGDAITPEQSQALSTVGMLPILLQLGLSKTTTLRGISVRGAGLALLGGILTCLGNIAYYAALTRGEKVATVVSLTALYPLVTVLLAMLLLGEKLNPVQMLGVMISLVAIWLFNVQAGKSFLAPTLIYALLPIVLWGLSGFLQKVATNQLSAAAAALIYLAAFVPVGLFFVLREPWPAAMGLRTWLIVVALGFFLGFGNVAVLRAFALGGKAAVIAPLGSLYPIISVPVAVLFLHEKVSSRELMGIVCAIASVAALSCERPASHTTSNSAPELEREANH